MAEFHKVKSSYYSKLLWDTTEIETPQKPEVRQLGSFDDQEGFNGFFPAPSFLKAAFLKIMEEYPVVRLDKLVKGVGGEVSQQLLDGTIWNFDTSHKFVKFVRVRGKGIDSKPFHCVMTIFNEFQQVCLERHMA